MKQRENGGSYTVRSFILKRNLDSSSNIIRQIKARKMRWAGHVVCIGEERKVQKVFVGKPRERDHWEDRFVEGRMESECILRRLNA
jgi:hypothetical protein